MTKDGQKKGRMQGVGKKLVELAKQPIVADLLAAGLVALAAKVKREPTPAKAAPAKPAALKSARKPAAAKKAPAKPRAPKSPKTPK